MAVRLVPALVLVALGCLAPPSSAAPRPKPAPAPRGWVVERVRFEPVDDSFLGVAGVGDYRGALELAPAAGGVGVVNDVGLDDYLKGLAEVPGTWPAEALKAQAIAARTYALYERANPVATAARALGADLCATDACQVYAGLVKERGPSGPAWAAAVDETAGQVLLYRDQPILAKYSSSNGGQTVSGGRPYLRAAVDPDDAHSPLHRWRSALPSALVSAALGLPSDGAITAVHRRPDSIVVIERTDGGGSVAPAFTFPALDFRARLNAAIPAPPGLPLAVPSNRFSVSVDGAAGTVVVDGRGWGHGIGMSQYGALGKALRGMRADDILAAYYGGVRPARVAPEGLPSTLKVAVELGRPGPATVHATGAFRVVDQGGAPLAVFTGGIWQVQPVAGGKLRVIPPPGQDGVPAVSARKPAEAFAAGTAPNVQFEVSAPANVHVSVQAPHAPTPAVVTTQRLVGRGTITEVLPPLDSPGRYTVTITADAGGGRRSAATVELDIQPPTPPTHRASPAATDAATPTTAAMRPAGFHATAATALALLLAAVAALGLTATRRLH